MTFRKTAALPAKADWEKQAANARALDPGGDYRPESHEPAPVSRWNPRAFLFYVIYWKDFPSESDRTEGAGSKQGCSGLPLPAGGKDYSSN
ncbi:MAG: hypothetical protein LBQ54_09970 [Planctomycetaceae bacterium]|nr:hypothetical protein [Planctomycetaceae bacterium]